MCPKESSEPSPKTWATMHVVLTKEWVNFNVLYKGGMVSKNEQKGGRGYLRKNKKEKMKIWNFPGGRGSKGDYLLP